MNARTFRPSLERLEDRCTPSATFFSSALGDGHSEVSLQIQVQFPPQPISPEIVSVSKVMPSGVVIEYPAVPTRDLFPPNPIRELFPPGALRGWLRAAHISSSLFLAPTTTAGTGSGNT